MAIFDIDIRPISRGAGRSAVAAAAYRSGARLSDERTGEVHDYTRRGGVGCCGLVGWDGDRAGLWNAAEAAERHPRARVAREVRIALPHELTDESRRALVEAFAASLAERFGCAVDWAIHRPGREGDARNHHAHLMLTVRRLEQGRLTAKLREWDDLRQGPEVVREVRALWEKVGNAALSSAGCPARLDRRSHRDRGSPDEPMEHLGPQATARLRKRQKTAAGERNRRRAERNRERRALLHERDRMDQTLAALTRLAETGGQAQCDRLGAEVRQFQAACAGNREAQEGAYGAMRTAAEQQAGFDWPDALVAALDRHWPERGRAEAARVATMLAREGLYAVRSMDRHFMRLVGAMLDEAAGTRSR